MKPIEKLAEVLLAQNWLLTTAESCTGGGVAYALTAIAGSSRWFERGFVTYSNLAKEQLLGVNPAIIEHHGAVSKETAQAMAEGALKHAAAHVSLAITGIAGPDGGTLEKPVGTVWFGFAAKGLPTRTAHQLFEGDRATIRQHAILFALEQTLAFISTGFIST